MFNRLRLLISKPVRIVALVAVSSFFGLRWWQSERETPKSLWARAVEADRAGDGATAELLLRKLVTAQPDNAEAHLALADLYSSSAAPAGGSARAKLDPRVLEQLQEVARLQPKNVAIQLRLMRAYFDLNRVKTASEAAQKAIEMATDDRLALYLAALNALEENDRPLLEEIVAKLKSDRSVPNFRIGLLLARVYQSTTEKDLLSMLIDGAFEHAVRMQSVTLETLPRDEIEALRELIVVGVDTSSNLTVAQQRAGEALTVLDQLSTTMKSEDAPRKLADSAARVVLILFERFPLTPNTTAGDKQVRDGLIKQSRLLVRAVLDDAEAPASVHLVEARVALLDGDETAALRVLERGVKALDSLPAAKRGDIAQLRLLAAQQLLRKHKFTEAEQHVESLREHAETAGWAELLAGAIAIEERRFDDAVTALRLARVKLGDNLQVLAGLAVAQLHAQQWSDALEVLRLMYNRVEATSDDQSVWTRRYFNTREQILLAEAAALLALGQTDDAFAIVKGLDNTPLAMAAQLMKVAHHRQQGERTEAWQALRASRARFPQEFAVVVEEVRLLESEKSVREAGIVLEEYARQHPQHLDSHLAVAVWRLDHGSNDAAVAWLKPLVTRFAKEISPRALLADAYLTGNNFDAADAVIADLKKNPAARSAVTQLEARAALLRQGLREAADILARSESETQRDVRLQFLRGELAGADGRHVEALSIYSRLAPYTDLRNAATRQILTSLAALARQQTPAEAEHQLIEILKTQPNDLLLLLAAVELAARQQKFDQAFAYLDRLATLQPSEVEVPFRRAQLLARKGDVAAALAEAQRAVAADPHHILSRLLLARLFVQQHEPLAALEQVERVIELKPGTTDAYVLEAWSLYHLNRRDEAVAVLRGQIRQQPDQPTTYVALASMLRQLGPPDESIRTLREGWERMPANRLLFEPLILSLCEVGKPDEAFSLARRFAGDRPDLKSAAYLADLFLRGKAYESARKLGQYALKLSKGQAEITIRMLLAENCLQQRQATGDKASLPEAREHYFAVLKEQPQNLVAANNLAWLLAEELNEPDEALRLVRSIRDQIPDERLPVSMIDTFLIVYRKLGLMNEALLLTEAALARHPEAALVHYQAGFVYAELGRMDDARTSLDKALALGLPADRTSAAREQRERLSKP